MGSDRTPATTWTDGVEPSDVDESGLPEGYTDLGLLGEGGMGEVRRVRDEALGRIVAMKLTHRRFAGVDRFREEAQATAQLQHPNIVPVYAAGQLADGRLWFTMREIKGRPFDREIEQVHAGHGTIRGLVAQIGQVCNALAYAHERGVIHRDVKPSNVMLGEHGEVYLVDWGLVKVLGAEEGVVTDRAQSGTTRTRMGTVTGTPVFMAPEQARGRVDQVDARSDVYGVGALLYAALTGSLPFEGSDAHAVIDRVLVGERRSWVAGAWAIPDELKAVCDRAMALDPAQRFQSAAELATEIRAWLDGARRREQALELVERALADVRRAEQLRDQAADLDAEATEALAAVERWRPEADKAPAWAKSDEAARLATEADLAEQEVDQGLQAALRLVPDLAEAHAALADRYRLRHERAEADRDRGQVAKMEALVRLHGRGRHDRYLKGDGALTLVTDPPGADVELFEYVERNRRLVEVPVRTLGRTPLTAVELPMGSYVCVVRHPDCEPVRYPVHIARNAHWDGAPPGATEALPIRLPVRGSLGSDAIYVPAGWFQAGGDPQAHEGIPRTRLWCDAMVVQRFPVTNRIYLAYLDQLVADGQVDEALARVPRERTADDGDGDPVYRFDGHRFSLGPDGDGDVWDPDWPAFMLNYSDAQAYLAWLARTTGNPWRLCAELEWEKAARGVDGRWFPWGDHPDPSWSLMNDSHPDTRLPGRVDTFPVDVSPYGVRGTAGNVADWVADAFHRDWPDEGSKIEAPDPGEPAPRSLRIVRGGSWDGTVRNARTCVRQRMEARNRQPFIGIRGAYRL